jgi:hypothetical protein
MGLSGEARPEVGDGVNREAHRHSAADGEACLRLLVTPRKIALPLCLPRRGTQSHAHNTSSRSHAHYHTCVLLHNSCAVLQCCMCTSSPATSLVQVASSCCDGAAGDTRD